MNSADGLSEQARELRLRAEEKFMSLKAEEMKALSPEEICKTLHELRVHQIELEMQNEELRRAQSEIEAARARYFDLYDMAPVGYCTVSENGQILESNLTLATMLGTARGALIARPFSRYILPEHADIYYLYKKKLVETGKPVTCELHMVKTDGAVFWARLESTIAQDADGTPVCHTVVNDITEHKHMEKRLMEAKEMQFATLIESLPGKVFLKDRNSLYVSCNENYAKDLKIRPEEIAGKTDYEFFPTHLAEKYREDDKRVMESGETVNIEEEFVMIKDFLRGAVRAVINTVKVPVRDKDGKVTGLLGFFWDITERKKTEDDLMESKALADAVIENVPLMIFLKEATDLRFVIFNRAGEDLLGYPREDLLGKNNLDLFPPEQAAHFMAKDREVLDGKVDMLDIPEEFILTAKKGQRLLHTRKVCIRGGDGITKYLLGISEDITERKQVEKDMAEAAQMKMSAEIKTKLTSMVSHELRTPIAALRESVSLVAEGVLGEMNEKQKEFLGIAKRNVDRLERLVNNVLDFQKMAAGRMEFDMRENDIDEIAIETIKDMSLAAGEKGLELVTDTGDNPKIIFDKDRIVQVLTNLLGNAIKFTEKGSVTIKTRLEDKVVHVIVRDTGPGIKSEDMEKLFHAFEQMDSERVKKKSGSGLGLAISKDIIVAHKGKIWAESVFGEGAAFHFTLPV